MAAPTTHPARSTLDTYNREHPNIWRLVDAARSQERAGWPKEVFMPYVTASELLQARYPGRYWDIPTVAKDSMRLSMLAAWRTTQGIYRFDTEVYDALIASSFDQELPVDSLARLPEWCVYIETPGREVSIEGKLFEQHGFWAWLDSPGVGQTQLAIGLHFLTPDSIIFGHLPLVGPVQEGITTMLQMNHSGPVDRMARNAFALLGPCLSVLLYLCDRADTLHDGKAGPQRPQPRYTKGREVTSPADAPVKWDVGVRDGEALRRWKQREAELDAAEEAAGRRRPRPHVRVGHWGYRWIGPRNGARKLVLRWIHPALVNADSPEELPAVIRHVQ